MPALYDPLRWPRVLGGGRSLGPSGPGKVRLAATFALGGALELISFRDFERQRLAVEFGLGGSMEVVGIPDSTLHRLHLSFTGGGRSPVQVNIPQTLGLTCDLGGAMAMHVFPPTLLQLSFELAGHTAIGVVSTVALRSTHSLGGAMAVGMRKGVPFGMTCSLGGAMVVGARAAKRLGLSMDLGGDMRVGISHAVTPDMRAAAIIAAMTTPPSPARADLIRNTVRDLHDLKMWTRLDALYMLAAHDQQASRINWINPGNAAAVVATPIFAADKGWKSDGTGHLNTGITLLQGGSYTSSGASLFVRVLEDLYADSTQVAVAVQSVSGGANADLRPQMSNLAYGNMFVRLNSSTALTVARPGPRNRLISAIRRSPLDVVAGYGGTVVGERSGLPASLPPANPVIIGGNVNVLGDFVQPYTSNHISVVGWGGTLTDTSLASLNLVVENYMREVEGPDAEAEALIAKMVPAPTAPRAQLIRNTVRELKHAGIWAKLDALYVLAAQNAQPSRLNWINPDRAATVVGAPIFTANRGWRSDGAGYLDTGHLLDGTGNYTLHDAMALLRVSGTNTFSGTTHAFHAAAPGTSLMVLPQNPTMPANSTGQINSNTSVHVTPRPGPVDRVTVMQRTGPTDIELYYAGNRAANRTDAPATALPAAYSATIGCGRHATTGVELAFYTANDISVVAVGGSLIPAQHHRLNEIIETYLANL